MSFSVSPTDPETGHVAITGEEKFSLEDRDSQYLVAIRTKIPKYLNLCLRHCKTRDLESCVSVFAMGRCSGLWVWVEGNDVLRKIGYSQALGVLILVHSSVASNASVSCRSLRKLLVLTFSRDLAKDWRRNQGHYFELDFLCCWLAHPGFYQHLSWFCDYLNCPSIIV